MMVIKNILENFKHYWYLMIQLITRDFKRKYKRSVLGVVWSLLYHSIIGWTSMVNFSLLFFRQRAGRGMGIFRLRASYFPGKESSQSSPGLRARTQWEFYWGHVPCVRRASPDFVASPSGPPRP